MVATAASAHNPRLRWIPAGLGVVAALLLLASLLFPYWQARLFAPQYRKGLTATMYAYKLTGDIEEIDILNHYVGVTKMDSLAVMERKIALPSVVLLALLCVFLPWIKRPLWRWCGALSVVFYPIGFLADMAYWMHHAATHLNPMAPLKLKPFSIPVIGTGKVGQFRSEVGPMPGFYIALAAGAVLLLILWLLREKKPR